MNILSDSFAMASALGAPAVRAALFAAGCFFLSGLLTGIWKYLQIATSETAQAKVYVDIAHRTSLLYSFAALLLAVFAGASAWTRETNLWAVLPPLVFFGLAIGGYVLHGLLGDTDNQFRRPHRIGAWALPRHALLAFMLVLIAAEVGGFLVLFAGVLRRFGWV
jgi:hypothetical protein